jgi:hypothetical protein
MSYSKQHYRLLAGVTAADCTPALVAERAEKDRRYAAWKQVVAERRATIGDVTEANEAEVESFYARRMAELGFRYEP